MRKLVFDAEEAGSVSVAKDRVAVLTVLVMRIPVPEVAVVVSEGFTNISGIGAAVASPATRELLTEDVDASLVNAHAMACLRQGPATSISKR